MMFVLQSPDGYLKVGCKPFDLFTNDINKAIKYETIDVVEHVIDTMPSVGLNIPFEIVEV